MDCMQYAIFSSTINMAVQFQHRKRYGLHAIRKKELRNMKLMRFNTASGMDCMQ